MKTDRELLELAAKAAGLNVGTDEGTYDDLKWWNPLTNDGDALRLAVTLRIDVLFDGRDLPDAHVETVANEPGLEAQPWAHEALQPDAAAATRRAIVRAAAAIGEAMP